MNVRKEHEGLSGRLRRWLTRDAERETLARQILYQGQLPTRKRIKGRLVSGSKLFLTLFAREREPFVAKSDPLHEGLERLLTRIEDGEQPDGRALLPYLCTESLAQRIRVNTRLAEAYLHLETPERLNQARVFAERAWLFSGFADDALVLYERILRKLNDTAALREAYKRVGIAAAREGSFARAINYFNHWQYAYQTVERVDRYAYDYDILNAVEEMAAPYRFNPSLSSLKNGERIRIAHLVRGIIEANSNLVRISLEFARHHDQSHFDVCFFVPETDEAIDASPQGREFIRAFKELGYAVVTAGPAKSLEATLLSVASKIYRAKPHILLTSAALADFSHAFLSALRPASLTVGLVQGPPEQFAPTWLDWAISWSRHPLMDTPVDCSHVEIKLNWASHGPVTPYQLTEIGLPADAFVLMSAGRRVKFQGEAFWRLISNLLKRHTKAHFVAVGPTVEELPLLATVLSDTERSRVHCLGWRQDVHQLLATADVVLDTYPNGGGQVLVEAMTLGVAIVAHRNDYLIRFTQDAWSPVEDFIDDPDLLVTRGDFAKFESITDRLILDDAFRRTAAARCKAAVAGTTPQAAIRNCEKVFTRLVNSR
jgi:glycosyltransferase involved in cell wall biosynthesis